MKSKNILLIQAAPRKEQACLWLKRMRDKMQDTANMGDIWSTGGAELGLPNARFSHFWSLPAVKTPLTLGMVIFLDYLPPSQHMSPQTYFLITFSSLCSTYQCIFRKSTEGRSFLHPGFISDTLSKAWHLYCQANNFLGRQGVGIYLCLALQS